MSIETLFEIDGASDVFFRLSFEDFGVVNTKVRVAFIRNKRKYEKRRKGLGKGKSR